MFTSPKRLQGVFSFNNMIMNRIIHKKEEILECIFNPEQKPEYDKIDNLLDELITICHNNERGVIFNGVNMSVVEATEHIKKLGKEIIIIGDTKTHNPEPLFLKDGKKFDCEKLIVGTNSFTEFDNNKNNEKWYRKFENKKRKR